MSRRLAQRPKSQSWWAMQPAFILSDSATGQGGETHSCHHLVQSNCGLVSN